jgi:uncharacterized protein (TIGR02118 family)
MFKVTIFYPNEAGKKFDMAYYCSKHMPMVKEKLGAVCQGMTVDLGLAGGDPSAPAPYTAMGHLLVDSIEGFQAAFVAHIGEIMADIPNYTDIQPIIQISEVKI